MKDNVLKIVNECGSNCTLIAVSKTKGVDLIREVYDSGIRDFGENKVQELLSKIDLLPNDIRWHMIGHLQTNKVKDVVGRVYLIHSVDSLRLAREISKCSVKKGVVSNILLEVNIASEESKYGFSVSELDTSYNEIKDLENINVLGLMCVAPNQSGSENRVYFKKMKKLSDELNLSVLSMGMSNDYKEAILEGATYIRVGTLIFGKRDYDIN